MDTDPNTPDYNLIDTEDKEELVYIAAKFGCDVQDILNAVDNLKTRKRSEIYSWLVDQTFKGQL